MKNFKKLVLLAGFGLFTAQTPLLQASEENKQNSFVDTAPARIMKWSSAIACVALATASIYYVPGILRNLYTATSTINTKTLPELSTGIAQITTSSASISTTIFNLSIWIQQKLTFNIGQNKLETFVKNFSQPSP